MLLRIRTIAVYYDSHCTVLVPVQCTYICVYSMTDTDDYNCMSTVSVCECVTKIIGGKTRPQRHSDYACIGTVAVAKLTVI